MKVTGKLVKEDGKALGGETVRLGVFVPDGGVRLQASQVTTGAQGAFTLNVTIRNLGAVLPRTVITMKRGRSWVRLSDAPATQTQTAIDYGTLVVTKQPVRKVGDQEMYAISQGGDLALARITAQLDAGKEQVSKLNKDLKGLRDIAGKRKTTITQLSGDLKGLRDIVAKRDAAITQLNKKVGDLQREVGERDTSLNLLGRRAQDLESSVAERDAEIERLRIGEGTSLDGLLTSIGDQLDTAKRRLNVGDSSYRLGALKMDLRVVPSKGGAQFRFPTKEDESITEGISSIKVDFDTAEPTPGDETVGSVVPDVTGYTTTFARRALEEAGFDIEISYRAVAVGDGEASSVGRVVMQIPAGGESLPLGHCVEVFVGKAMEG